MPAYRIPGTWRAATAGRKQVCILLRQGGSSLEPHRALKLEGLEFLAARFQNDAWGRQPPRVATGPQLTAIRRFKFGDPLGSQTCAPQILVTRFQNYAWCGIKTIQAYDGRLIPGNGFPTLSVLKPVTRNILYINDLDIKIFNLCEY